MIHYNHSYTANVYQTKRNQMGQATNISGITFAFSNPTTDEGSGMWGQFGVLVFRKRYILKRG